MKGSFKRDLGIMKPLGIKFDFGAACTSAEEIHCSAFAHHVHCPLPGLRTADRFNHHICSPLLGSECPHGIDGIVDCSNLDGLICAESARVLHLLIALYDGDYSQATQLGYLHEHQADGASPYDDYIVSRL